MKSPPECMCIFLFIIDTIVFVSVKVFVSMILCDSVTCYFNESLLLECISSGCSAVQMFQKLAETAATGHLVCRSIFESIYHSQITVGN